MRKENKKLNTYSLHALYVVFLFLTVLALSAFIKKSGDKDYRGDGSLPGTIKIKENFFCDKTELRNLDWAEYTYWIGRVFGESSEEYYAVLPDTNAWKEIYPCLDGAKEVHFYKNDTTVSANCFPQYYFRHPAYRDFPVVGISQEQAMQYSKWRSDRVFEYLLIKFGKINMQTEQDRANHFTIARYFSGNYYSYVPDTNFKYYPDFRLPTLKEWRYIRSYSDSIDSNYYRKHTNRKCDNCTTSWSDCQLDIVPCRNDTLVKFPTVPVSGYQKASPISNLIGNVSEWTSENGICAGGGWVDTKESVLSSDTFSLSTQNAWTGLRNVCQWKKWGE